MSRLFGFPPQSAGYTDAQAVTATNDGRGPPLVSTRWYWPHPMLTLGVGAALGLNTKRFLPVVIPRAISITDLAARVTTAAASSNVSFALYARSLTTGLPTGLPLAHTALVSSAATGMVSSPIIEGTVALAAGTYWMAVDSDNATPALLTSVQSMLHALEGTATLANLAFAQSFLTLAATAGTWGDMSAQSFTETTSGGNSGVLAWKAA